VTIKTPLTATNVHVRGGRIIPMQDSAMTTDDVHSSPYTLLVPLGDSFSKAIGVLYIDDGDQMELLEYIFVEYAASSTQLTSIVKNSTFSLSSALLTTVDVRGVAGGASVCSAELREESSSTVVKASYTSFIQHDVYNQLIISFDKSSAVNIATSFTLTWNCEYPSDSSTESGWDSLSQSVQLTIIIGIPLLVLIIIFAIVLYMRSPISFFQNIGQSKGDTDSLIVSSNAW
jgi:hypothetical protein